MKNLLAALLLVVLVTVAGVIFLAVMLLHRILMLLVGTSRGAAGAGTYFLLTLLSNILARVIGFVIVSLLVGALIYLALEYNPELRNDVNNGIARIEQKIENFSGIHLPSLAFPTLEEMWQMITRKGSSDNPNPLYLSNLHIPDSLKNLSTAEIEQRIRQLRQMPKLPDDAAKELQQLEELRNAKFPANLPGIQLPTGIQLPDVKDVGKLANLIPPQLLPKELQPLMNVTMDPETLKQFKSLAEGGGFSTQGAMAALPILKSALYGGNPELSGASYKALSQMNSPEAKAAIAQYEKLMEQMVHDANLRH